MEKGPPRRTLPSSFSAPLSQKEFLPSCRNPYRRFLSDNDQGILSSAGRQTDHPTTIPRTIAAGPSVMAIGQQWCHSLHRANVSSSTWATASGTSQLRKLLPQALSDSHPVKGFDAEHGFPALGRTNYCSTPAGSLQTAMTRNGSFWPSSTIVTTVGRKLP